MVFDRRPRGYYDQLTDHYRVVVIENSAFDNSPTNIASRTADRECADILAVADAAGVDRFAWFGFSFGGVVGLACVGTESPLGSCLWRLASMMANMPGQPIPKRKLRRVELPRL